MNNLKEAEKAYFAGLFDGEGYVGAYQNGPNPEALTLTLGLTHEPTVRLLQETFGGGCYVTAVKENCKDFWTWIATDRNTKEGFLKAVQPYVRIKKEAVAVALAFLRTVSITGGTKLTDEELVLRHVLTLRLQALTKRGAV